MAVTFKTPIAFMLTDTQMQPVGGEVSSRERAVSGILREFLNRLTLDAEFGRSVREAAGCDPDDEQVQLAFEFTGRTTAV